ncbi:MAG: (2Fe-2S)-binding protein [Deferrisomatales bacterium]|nr:(2Fe-2S)-binding protein [Deferrisomatales bacterium]
MIGIVRFTLNGRAVNLEVDGERPLLWVLRTDLGATGAKYGCGEGHCGSCTVLVDGAAVLACQTRVRDVAGRQVLTIEGLEADGELHPLQRAFVEHGALQCGYCTPGMILKAHSLLAANPRPTQGDVRRGLEGNLCRCGAHKRIVEAVLAASRETGG